MRRAPGVALARREVAELAERLGVAVPTAARPGADLAVRDRRGLGWPAPPVLLRAADGWIHPGPPTARDAFADMARSLGAPAPAAGERWPALDRLAVDALDAEAGAWMLPAAAVRTRPARPDPVPRPSSTDVAGAMVVLLGTAWATPLVGHVLARLGARVVKIDHPRRDDPFPLRRELVRGQELRAFDLDAPVDRERVAALVAGADLVVVGHPPRVLANAGIVPRCPVLRVAAFADDDRPGYGAAAEARGGWAARTDPPRLGRSSVADPVAGMVGALTAVELLTAAPAAHARVSLEGAVGRLLDRERHDG